MKLITTLAAITLIVSCLPANAQTPTIHLSVGGEISPGVYGQVQFGNAPPPPVFYPQPMIIERRPAVVVTPIYMHVPPGHAKNWRKHCRKYNACNRPVYFVRSEEYQPNYRRHKEDKHQRKHRDEGRDRHRD
jgi:hypothetical protein